MAPARPFWKGYLKLSLVSCPIALYTGTTSTERVSFRQINKKTGNRLRQQLIDEVTREPVAKDFKTASQEYIFETAASAGETEVQKSQLREWMKLVEAPVPSFLAKTGHQGNDLSRAIRGGADHRSFQRAVALAHPPRARGARGRQYLRPYAKRSAASNDRCTTRTGPEIF